MKTDIQNLCGCGCKHVTKIYRGRYRKYVHGHNKSTLGMRFGSHSKEHNKKISIALSGIKKPVGFGKKGKDNPSWKGDKVGYGALHVWVRRNLGKVKRCEVCLRDNKKAKDGRNIIQWANIDHLYKRDPIYWKQMCPSCHKKHDLRLSK